MQQRELKVTLAERLEALPNFIKNILSEAGKIGDKLGYDTYVVGGFVRDLILGCDNQDIDIVVVGNGIRFAGELAEAFNAQCRVYKQFKTSVVTIDDNFSIDVVTARKEYYPHPAVLPTITKGTIKDDLFRRDFTINSMAIKLNNEAFELVDYFGGIGDLMQGRIKVLHQISFIHDPTRLFRALRFEQRYGFKFEKYTLELALNALGLGVVELLSRERISNELFIALEEKTGASIIDRMFEIGLLAVAFPRINYTKDMQGLLADIEPCWDSLQVPLDRALVYILALHSNMTSGYAEEACHDMRLTRHYRYEVLKLIGAKDTVMPVLLRKTQIQGYEVYSALKNLSPEVMYILTLMYKEPVVLERIQNFINYLRHIKLNLTGKDLKQIGFKPGPQYMMVLETILKAKINGEIGDNEEREFAYKLIKQSKGR